MLKLKIGATWNTYFQLCPTTSGWCLLHAAFQMQPVFPVGDCQMPPALEWNRATTSTPCVLNTLVIHGGDCHSATLHAQSRWCYYVKWFPRATANLTSYKNRNISCIALEVKSPKYQWNYIPSQGSGGDPFLDSVFYHQSLRLFALKLHHFKLYCHWHSVLALCVSVFKSLLSNYILETMGILLQLVHLDIIVSLQTVFK